MEIDSEGTSFQLTAPETGFLAIAVAPGGTAMTAGMPIAFVWNFYRMGAEDVELVEYRKSRIRVDDVLGKPGVRQWVCELVRSLGAEFNL